MVSIMLAICLAGVAFGQFKMERSTFAFGTPGKSDAGGSFVMREAAGSQTADDIADASTYTTEQGYIHRPFELEMDYDVADLATGEDLPVFAAGLTPQAGWYEPTGKLEIFAESPVTVGDTLYYFHHWESPTGAVFNDPSSNFTWLPYYQSHSVTAVYQTQYKVQFAAKTVNNTVYGVPWGGYMKPLDATDFVEVNYTSQGAPATAGPIYDDTPSAEVWVDRGTEWQYTSRLIGDTRWHSVHEDFNRVCVKEDAGATILVDYFQQFLCDITIDYEPDESYLVAGYVHLLEWNQFNVDIAVNPSHPLYDNGRELYDDGDVGKDWHRISAVGPQWADAGSRLAFPEMTTEGWFTVRQHEWDILDKPLTKPIDYSQPANFTVDFFMWRGYSLIGIPIYPTENTDAYWDHATASGCPLPASVDMISRGDQDVVVYDDIGACGRYGDLWAVSKYYPHVGAYYRYRGPGLSLAEGSVEPFYPGRGFWFIQDIADSLEVDVEGILVNLDEPFEIWLDHNNRSAAYMHYHMIANPFCGADGNAVEVRWTDAQVRLTYSSDDTLSVKDAALAGWIDADAQFYRGGGYVVVNAATVDPEDESNKIGKAEGFWVKTNDGLTVRDTVIIIMRPRSIVDPGRVRPSPEVDQVVSKWRVRFGAECEAKRQRDSFNWIGYKEYIEEAVNPTYTGYEMPEYTYPGPHLRVFFRGEENKEFASLYSGDRASVMTWTGVIDGRAVKGEKVTVNWDTEDIPEGMQLHLKDSKNDKYIDMLAQREYTFISDGSVFDVQIIANAPLAWVTKEVADAPMVPEEFFINSPTPNPFNAATSIEFGLAEGDEGRVRVEVFDITGRKVNTLLDDDLEPGIYRFTWRGNDISGRGVASGTYFVRFNGADREIVKQVILLK